MALQVFTMMNQVPPPGVALQGVAISCRAVATAAEALA